MCSCKGKRIKSTGGNSSRVRWASIEVTFLAEITHWAPLNNVICWDHTHTHRAILKSIPSKSTLRRLLDLAGLHFTTSERSDPFWQSTLYNLFVQALVIYRLDYCNALLAGLPSNRIKPLKMIQNAAARLVFNEPKRAHVTPLFVSLHWLPVAARIQFKTLMLAYKPTTGSAPPYFHSHTNLHPLQKSEIC